MNAILKPLLEAAEKLSPADQKILAAEMEKRAYELWLDAEIEKGEASAGNMPMEGAFDRLKRKYGS